MVASEPILETEQLTKEFGDLAAVRDLNLSIRKGEVYGFLGPNGAGKTTTIHMLLSLVRPTSGRIRLFGEEVDPGSPSPRNRIGVLPSHGQLYDNLTAREHIEFVARIKNADDDPESLCERVGLETTLDQRVRGFSTGMRQRLKLAMALVGDPELLVLDEPTSGLDPNGARQMRELIQTETKKGVTVFFSSHILGQVERICDRVGILDSGRLVAEDTISGLRSRTEETNTVQIEFDDAAARAVHRVQHLDAVTAVNTDDRKLELVLEDIDATNEVLSQLCQVEGRILSVNTNETSLEDLFAAYTTEEVKA
ncbi:ABC transporter related protein (plasmid) [Natrialba magadii ATCC 43099]|uniref:ABC transporter n=1 Tax=Natrialba magadii (strain ATCC 43099 / DSM 3394 / CCM 3739 / CIP 104546 / IAM 13178 / JCM 8861 / NBRC 102185 / NCIMB 2190 / MS3) TaxID=547559 RepID=D3T1Y9_NATMM|nr:ABC transporter ATP-binding protein [Natrialba magadii]ADD07598.1 ABC transporter related protein [Natrialba magadii ATCC 43099]ELY27073.1 ABC transporter [Natrialba magadii ATCC 43099]